MDDWWKEFENPVIPYASDFVERVQRKKKLEHLNNILYETRSHVKTTKVRFDDIKTVFYYKPIMDDFNKAIDETILL